MFKKDRAGYEYVSGASCQISARLLTLVWPLQSQGEAASQGQRAQVKKVWLYLFVFFCFYFFFFLFASVVLCCEYNGFFSRSIDVGVALRRQSESEMDLVQRVWPAVWLLK